MGNESIYSVGKEKVKQNPTFCQTKTFMSPSRVGTPYNLWVTKV